MPEEVIAPGTTGRSLVLLRTDAMAAGIKTITEAAGIRVARSAEIGEQALHPEEIESGNAIVFDELAVAVVSTPPDQMRALNVASTEESGILAIEPERVVYAIDETLVGAPAPPLPMPVVQPGLRPTNNAHLQLDYLRGYREAVNHLVDSVLANSGVSAGASATAVAAAIDESTLTWGLQVTNVAQSQYTGKGIRVAVLDTGIDLGHPDFTGRAITTRSFIAGETVQDGHGHGTHTVGTACGPKDPSQLPRYGIACESDIYVGKVLDNRGSGADGGILAGINWAITNQCRVVSMSLGAPTTVGQTYSRIFETVARRALAKGTLIIAAAGNESQRPSLINPVGHPANCPSVLAVGALDSSLQIAWFSSGGLNPQGGQVDIAGPGVNVRSSWPRPTLYNTISGTSMATPHVSGIAALHAEANSDVVGGALGWLLLQSARRLDLPTRDIGAGLVQAP
jgi:subtilisin family serine protease